MSRIRMVTFDVTGTLLKFRNPVSETYAQVGQTYGIKADPAVLKNSFENEYAKMVVEHPIFGKNTGLGWFQWWTYVIRGTFRDYAKSRDDEAKIAKVAEDLVKFYQTSDAWVVQPGSHHLLQFLKRTYFKVGVISNFDERLHAILKAGDLQQYFDFILTSYEVGYEKPDVRIFDEAIKRGLNVHPREAVHIGNDVRTDYAAAKSAGWSGMLIASEGQKFGDLVSGEDVFKDLDRVKYHFQKLS